MQNEKKSAIINSRKVIGMIHRLSKKLADFLADKEVISPAETDIYVYGYETIISGFVDFCIVLGIGLIFKQMLTMLIFFAMFISVRLYTGGYHANTFIGCKIVFTSICLSMVYLSELPFSLVLSVLISILFIITGIFLAPVENYNKPLTKDEQMKYHKISIVISILWVAVALFSYFFAIKICRIITLTAMFITLLMVIGEYRKEGNNDEKQ